MERSGDVTLSVVGRNGATPMSGFHQRLDVADVDIDLRSLIARWSSEGEVAVARGASGAATA